MKTTWTKGLDKELSRDVVATFKGALIMRNRMKKMLEDKIDSAERGSRNKEGYDCSNWAYKQADTIGYKRAMQEVISLLEG